MLFYSLERRSSMLAGDTPVTELKLRIWAVIVWFGFLLSLLLFALVAHSRAINYPDAASAALHLAEVIGGAGIGAIFGERSGAKDTSP